MKKIFLTLCLFFSPLATFAQEKAPLQIRTIAISPYGIESSNQKSGIYYDLANLLLKRLDTKGNNLIYPYARIMNELKSGETDLTIIFKYKELEPYVEYIYPLPTLKNVVLGRQGQNFESIASLQGKTIAYLRGAQFSNDIDNDTSIVKQRVTDFKQGLLMLRANRVDAIIGPMQPILFAANRLDFPMNFFGTPLVVSERTPWLQVSNKSINKVSINELKAIFSKIMTDGDYKEIKYRYLLK